MKKLTAYMLVLLIVVSILGMTGCGNKSATNETTKTSATVAATAAPAEQSTTTKPAHQPLLGVTLRDTTNVTYIKMMNSIKAECDAKGIKMVVQDAKENLATQITQIENFVNMGCDYIFVNVFDAKGIEDAVKKARDAGCFMIIHDATLNSASLTLGVSNYDYGYAVGTCAANFINSTPSLKSAAKVEWGLESYTKVADIIPRSQGIKDALKKLAPNAELVATQDVYSVEVGVSSTENFLQAHPNMKIVCGVTDVFIYGAYQAFASAGKNGDEYGVFGCDGTDAALKLISEGTSYRGTVWLDLVETCKTMVDMLYDHSQGKTIDNKLFFKQVNVTKDNIKDFWPAK